MATSTNLRPSTMRPSDGWVARISDLPLSQGIVRTSPAVVSHKILEVYFNYKKGAPTTIKTNSPGLWFAKGTLTWLTKKPSGNNLNIPLWRLPRGEHAGCYTSNPRHIDLQPSPRSSPVASRNSSPSRSAGAGSTQPATQARSAERALSADAIRANLDAVHEAMDRILQRSDGTFVVATSGLPALRAQPGFVTPSDGVQCTGLALCHGSALWLGAVGNINAIAGTAPPMSSFEVKNSLCLRLANLQDPTGRSRYTIRFAPSLTGIMLTTENEPRIVNDERYGEGCKFGLEALADGQKANLYWNGRGYKPKMMLNLIWMGPQKCYFAGPLLKAEDKQ